MLNNLKTFLNNEDYRLSIIPSGVHVLSYTRIIDITDNELKLSLGKKLVTVKGSNLKMKKLDKKELLIKGIVNKLEINE